MSEDVAPRRERPWRIRTVCVPVALALVACGIFIVAEGIAGVMGSWDTPMPGLWWIKVGIIGHCVLAALAAIALAVALRSPPRRRAVTISAWMIIPVGFGWLVLTTRLVSGL